MPFPRYLCALLCLLGSLSVFAQTEEVSYKDQPLGQIFRQWQEWGYSINYSPALIDTNERITFRGKAERHQIIRDLLNTRFILFSLQKNVLVISGYDRRVRISGTIIEYESEETLPYVNVFVRNRNLGTFTNDYGYFSLDIPVDSFVLEISCIGYQSKQIAFTQRGNYRQDISLKPSITLREAIITDSIHNRFIHTDYGTFRFDQNDLKELPGMGNEKDLIRGLQLMSGVQKGTDGSNGMFVRGGSVDQNLIMIDDAPVYNSSHLLGFFSIFSSDAIKSAELSKSGFNARYGGRLSSVLDVKTREGNRSRFSGFAKVGTVASTLTLEGPIKKNSSSFYVTARRSNLDWISVAVDNADGGFVPTYYFYDINAKVNIDLGSRRKIYLSLYHGNDYISMTEGLPENGYRMNISWSNLIGTFRMNRIFNDKVFGNLAITYSKYNFGNGQKNSFFNGMTFSNMSTTFRSNIEDWSLRYDLDIFKNPKNTMRLGFQGIYHRFLPDFAEYQINGAMYQGSTNFLPTFEYGLYEENVYKINPYWTLEAGLRFSGVVSADHFYWNLEPRASFIYRKKRQQLAFSYDRMAQYVRLQSQTSVGVPVYIWLPSSKQYAPPVSDHFGFSWSYRHNEWLKLGIEPYFKVVQRQVQFYPNLPLFSLMMGLPSKVNINSGYTFDVRATGMDLTLEGGRNKWKYRLSYSPAMIQMRNPEFNRGEWFYGPQDRRHDGAIWVNYEVNSRWKIGATWVLSTGSPLSIPDNQYSLYTDPTMSSGADPFAYNSILNYYSLKNYPVLANYRIKNYHRLDMFANYSFGKKRLRHELEFGVYNAYSRANAFLYTIDINDQGETVLTQVSLIPIIPSISYQIRW